MTTTSEQQAVPVAQEKVDRFSGETTNDATRHLAIRSPLNRAIYRAVRGYRLSNMAYADDQGGSYPLVDLMSNPAPSDIGTGEMQMIELVDEIEIALNAARLTPIEGVAASVDERLQDAMSSSDDSVVGWAVAMVAKGGPHEWGYRDPVDGTFISDPWPFHAAEYLAKLAAPDTPSPAIPEGTFACPICGKDTPHYHSPEEVKEHRETEAWVEESWQQARPLFFPEGTSGEGVGAEEAAHLQTIDERDALHEALSDAYRAVCGREPQWSNLFGLNDAVDDMRQAALTPDATQTREAEATKPTVLEAADAVPVEAWQVAVSCGDMLDRFPCKRCGADAPIQCKSGLSTAEIDATRDFVNGYGWDAARLRAALPAGAAKGEAR